MRRLLAILLLLPALAWGGTNIPGIVVTAPITTGDTDNTFPVADTSELQGGYMQVADVAARDAIPAARRKAGMRVYAAATGLVYQLAADLTTWGDGGVMEVHQGAAEPDNTPKIRVYDNTGKLRTTIYADGSIGIE